MTKHNDTAPDEPLGAGLPMSHIFGYVKETLEDPIEAEKLGAEANDELTDPESAQRVRDEESNA